MTTQGRGRDGIPPPRKAHHLPSRKSGPVHTACVGGFWLNGAGTKPSAWDGVRGSVDENPRPAHYEVLIAESEEAVRCVRAFPELSSHRYNWVAKVLYLRSADSRPSKVMSNAFSAAFHRIIQRFCPVLVGSRLITARYSSRASQSCRALRVEGL